MKKLIILSCAAFMLLATPAMAQKKSNTKGKSSTTSSKQATPPTKFVELNQRRFGELLGGYDYREYSVVEDHANFNKKEWKARAAAAACSSFDELFEKLPGLPDASAINTREKMADYLGDIMVIMQVVDKSDDISAAMAANEAFNKAMMENAKAAAKGLPYDTEIHIDPKNNQYQDLMQKIRTYFGPLAKRHDEYIMYTEVSDLDYKVMLLDIHQIMPDKQYFNIFAPLAKQLAKEWFATKECQTISDMDAALVARGMAEGGKKTPQWFVDGRRAEIPYVEAYNQRQIERWLKKFSPHMETTKANLRKVIDLYKQVEVIRGDDEMSKQYVETKIWAHGVVVSFFQEYLGWLYFVQGVPMVQTPPTMEGKKFQKYDRPEHLSGVFTDYNFPLGY